MRESKGQPQAVSDNEMVAAVKEIARKEGLIIAPEGGGNLNLRENPHEANACPLKNAIASMNPGHYV